MLEERQKEKQVKIKIFDSTLRDGAQGEGISFSVQDKINILKILDNLGVDYVEAGNPFSNPKDLEFFKRVENLQLKNTKLTAFGSTRKKGVKVEDDENILALVNANTSVCVIFGKAWDFHVKSILKTTLEENLSMISDTIAFLKSKGKEVIFDAEHFFDGYKANKEYALKTLIIAKEAGVDSVCLCDTNGGGFPFEIEEITKDIVQKLHIPVGVHLHNDTGMAVANSILAVKSGADMVQGTLIGFGERCGNANLSTVISNLQFKMNYECIPNENLAELTEACVKIADLANVRLEKNMPYVGKSAFAHKAGMHIDGVNKSNESFEHIAPEKTGNLRRFLVSEVSGRSTLLKVINKIDSSITKENPVTAKIIQKIKQMEFEGYQYESAETSLNLLISKELGIYQPLFKVERFKAFGEQDMGGDFVSASAIVKIIVNGQTEIAAAEGQGPVDALDKALRKALKTFYPSIKNFKLTDYKVRILDSKAASSATTRVLIESSDGNDIYSTVGVSKDIIQASLIALVDALEYKLHNDLKIK